MMFGIVAYARKSSQTSEPGERNATSLIQNLMAEALFRAATTKVPHGRRGVSSSSPRPDIA